MASITIPCHLTSSFFFHANAHTRVLTAIKINVSIKFSVIMATGLMTPAIPNTSKILNILDNCPIDLCNCDYVDIFRSIANKSSNVDVDSIKIIYESGGSSV